ncbi:MAG: VTT domain-containing protein [Pseudomonadota bacterium]
MNRTVLRGLLAALVITAIAVAVSYRDQLNPAVVEQWVEGAGMAGPLLFMLIYALGTVLFLPGSVLTLAGGAIFGPVWGTLYNLTGATLGATLAFLIARYLAAEWVERKSGGKLKQIKHGVENEGWRFVAFVRLVPLFPFNVLNYALGLTRIRLSHYIIASYLCMLPGAVAYTYLGYAGREAVAGGEGAIRKGLLALALLAAVAFLPRLISRMRQGPVIDVETLKQQLDGAAEPLVLDVRGEEEYRGELGHIHGAVNIPLPELAQRLAELGDDPQRPIALVCRTDVRSHKAALLLARQGFADLHVVRGGMTAWNEQHFPVE